jgi:hypothetical protein
MYVGKPSIRKVMMKWTIYSIYGWTGFRLGNDTDFLNYLDYIGDDRLRGFCSEKIVYDFKET